MASCDNEQDDNQATLAKRIQSGKCASFSSSTVISHVLQKYHLRRGRFAGVALLGLSNEQRQREAQGNHAVRCNTTADNCDGARQGRTAEVGSARSAKCDAGRSSESRPVLRSQGKWNLFRVQHHCLRFLDEQRKSNAVARAPSFQYFSRTLPR